MMNHMNFRTLSILLLTISAVLSAGVFSQVVMAPANVDFGTIDRHSERVVDLVLTNNSDKNAVLLRYEFPPEYTFIVSSKEIVPRGTINLRVKFNPRSKGVTGQTAMMWFSNMSKPLEFGLSATTEYVDNADNPACPDFMSRPFMEVNNQPITVEVRDILTNQIITNARVRIFSHGSIILDRTTDQMGQVQSEIHPGYYFVHSEKTGYAEADTSLYLNRRSDFLVLYLEQATSLQDIQVPPAEEFPTANEENPVLTSSDFSIDRFLPNQIIFLLDVSASMKQKERLELVKVAFKDLFEMLRPQDRVSLITFSSESDVILENIKGTDKTDLSSVVNELKAEGMTASVKGFQVAYSIAKKHFITQANNQVIVISDGMFGNADQQTLIKLAVKAKESHVKTSLLSVRGTEVANENMKILAVACRGNHFRIDNPDDATRALRNEIKQSCLKP